MKARVTAGVGAWFLGVTAATSLSLIAVAHLGTDLTGTQGSTLSTSDVDRALAGARSAPPSESPSDGSTTGSPPAAQAGPTSPSTPSASSPTASDSAGAAPTASSTSPSHTSGSASSSAADSQNGWSTKRRLSGRGGQVVAECQGSLAYLISWSPAQGFQVGPVQRGPARSATVVFVDDDLRQPAPIRVFCVNGTPNAVFDDSPRDW
jgi:hypothetical protein